MTRRPDKSAPLAAPDPHCGGTHRLGVGAELPGLLRDLGADPMGVLAAAGAPVGILDDPDGRISFAMSGHILEQAVLATRCPHLGVLLGLRISAQSRGLVADLMATAPTLKDALIDLTVNQIRYLDGAVSYLTVQDGAGFWGYALQSMPRHGLAPILDTAEGIAAAAVLSLTGRRAEEVRLSHAGSGDGAAYRQAFGIPVTFDAEQTGLVLPPDLLATPVLSADPALRRSLQRQVAEYWARAQPPVAEQARRVLAALVTTDHPTQERVAVALGLHPRTLNRRLQAEGTSFRAVLAQARHDVACQLLGATRLPVTQIGLALGYATPPGFVRAFRREAGLPPSAWRRRLAGPEPARAAS